MSGARPASLRVLVVEDEGPARSYLVELLQQTGAAEVMAAVPSLADAQQALAPESGIEVDVVFVDNLLSSRKNAPTGLSWVRAASHAPGAPLFVLATAYKQHALEAYELGVADYLVKPFTEQRVSECVRRLTMRVPATYRPQLSAPLRIVARRQRTLVFLELDEVWACEAADRLTYAHSARGRLDLDLTLSAIGASFGRTLARVHRNWLVNVARVIELERDAGETSLLVGAATGAECNGIRVPVAKERAATVRELLMAKTIGIRHG